MRLVRTLDHPVPFDARTLRNEPRWLYRRAADRDEAVLGMGCRTLLETDETDQALEAWRVLLKCSGPSMGYLSYDLRGSLFGQSSRHPRTGHWPLIRWFVPEVMVHWVGGRTHFLGTDLAAVDELADRLCAQLPQEPVLSWGGWSLSTDKDAYLRHTAELLEHVQRGDIYEVNYCVERKAHLPDRDPHAAFLRAIRTTQASFAAFHAWADRHAICLSPERVLWPADGCVH